MFRKGDSSCDSLSNHGSNLGKNNFYAIVVYELVITIVDRQEGAGETMKENGKEHNSLVTLDEL